jgi:hypothetical protein
MESDAALKASLDNFKKLESTEFISLPIFPIKCSKSCYLIQDLASELSAFEINEDIRVKNIEF